jgi:PBP1b-binding outer membrane lipoprotein LpoB
MMRKGLNSVVKISICILIAMGLLVTVSCKQSEEEQTPPEVQKQPSPNTPVVSEKPDVPKVTPPPKEITEKAPEPVS